MRYNRIPGDFERSVYIYCFHKGGRERMEQGRREMECQLSSTVGLAEHVCLAGPVELFRGAPSNNNGGIMGGLKLFHFFKNNNSHSIDIKAQFWETAWYNG